MNAEKGLVSIGLPIYNGAETMRRTIDSLLSQTHQKLELIISDNASTDDTQKICEDYAKTDERVKYFRQEKNQGMSRNYEFVLEQARGEYFMWAADDDYWEPSFISTLKSVLDNNPNYGVAMSSVSFVDENGQNMKDGWSY